MGAGAKSVCWKANTVVQCVAYDSVFSQRIQEVPFDSDYSDGGSVQVFFW